MSTTNKRPTPETDAENRRTGWPASYYEFACRLERERDEARHQITMMIERGRQRLESDSAVASCDCLTKSPEVKHHKPGCKYRLICERDYARDELVQSESRVANAALYERASKAMRSAIKEAANVLETVSALPVARMYPDGPCLELTDHDAVEASLAKLQTFLKP